jgi:hypothetical protein
MRSSPALRGGYASAGCICDCGEQSCRRNAETLVKTPHYTITAYAPAHAPCTGHNERAADSHRWRLCRTMRARRRAVQVQHGCNVTLLMML